METWLHDLIMIVGAVFASSGFWAFITRKANGNDAEKEMLRGLGHDRIVSLGMKYIERGYITQEEYENLHDYLYLPYEKLNGNGSAKRVMDEVNRLPIHKHIPTDTTASK